MIQSNKKKGMQKATEPEGTLSTQICVVCSIEIIEEEL
jgi:hypothetical protein